jgi:hypothetical protein
MPRKRVNWAKTTMRDHIISNVRVNAKGCWIWQRAKDAESYGQIRKDYKIIGAHRASYEAFIGPIPKRHDIDHLCRVPSCVNPKHLEPVTRLENLDRGDISHRGKWQSNKKACPRGHPYNKANTYRSKQSGGLHNHRACRACHAENQRRYRREALIA